MRLLLANEPRPAALRHTFHLTINTGAGGDVGAETPTLGYPFILEAIYLNSSIDANVTLLWNVLVDNVPYGGSRSPFDGFPVIQPQYDSSTFTPRRVRFMLAAPLMIRPRFAWWHAGYRLRFAANTSSNPFRIGCTLDVTPIG